jgi:hypothetical protein
MQSLPLPHELVLIVISALQGHNKTLARLSLCSKELHALVEPILYSTFTQTGDEALPCFLRTILAKPSLALHLKHLTIEAISDEAPPQIPIESIAPPPSLYSGEKFWQEQYKKATSPHALDMISNIITSPDAEAYGWDAAMTLLLILVQDRLTTWTVKNYWRSDFNSSLPGNGLLNQWSNSNRHLVPSTWQADQHSSRSRSLFVHGGDADDVQTISLSHPIMVLRVLDNVQKFHGHRIFLKERRSGVNYSANQAIEPLTWTDVSLVKSKLDAAALQRLPRLRKLVYYGREEFDAVELKRKLQISANSLEELVLHQPIYPSKHSVLDLDPLGSMLEFKVLR